MMLKERPWQKEEAKGRKHRQKPGEQKYKNMSIMSKIINVGQIVSSFKVGSAKNGKECAALQFCF